MTPQEPAHELHRSCSSSFDITTRTRSSEMQKMIAAQSTGGFSTGNAVVVAVAVVVVVVVVSVLVDRDVAGIVCEVVQTASSGPTVVFPKSARRVD